MRYRLLALTIDGALIRSNLRISRQTKEAIDYVKNKGVYVTLATERPFSAAKKIAKALKVNGVLLTHNGAYIAQSSAEPIFVNRIQEDKAFHISEILEQHHCQVYVHHESFSIGSRMEQKNQLIAKMTVGIGDSQIYPVQFVDSICDKLLNDPIAPLKIQAEFIDDREKQKAIKELKQAIPNIRLYSGVNGRLHIVNEGVSKARAIQILGMQLGVALKEMVAIGAHETDLEMVKQVGLGVAMGNSNSEIKRAADWVTRSNDQDGVSYMVREVFRKQLRVKL
ncbi:Cof-type HAD-IIB family hydrolase [Halalkalibacterium ligniniphilum]|uniref:Cof-type HAD-IIB family hydrolase n=1 Tax=Halalkalibacterium ligniniphilum TaxID=1134413 RepID=UPI000344B8D4|nr:Cof-type HAD-IIB family hydrolase [Halalkalibacterium ligniniphilum]